MSTHQAHPPSITLRQLLPFWVVFWLLMLTVSIQEHAGDAGISWWEPLLWEGSSALVASLLFSMLFHHGKKYYRYIDRPLWWFCHYQKWLPLFIVVFVAITYGLRHGVYALVGRTYAHEGGWQLLLTEGTKLVIFSSLWLTVLFAFYSFALIKAQREDLLRTQKELVEAQLAQLKAQLNPHFLFNTLNTISAYVHSDANRADQLISQLADLLRTSLRAGQQDTHSLQQEVSLLQTYAQIMLARFGERVDIHWQLAPESLRCQLPVFLLQPILENAFKHGVEPVTHAVKIKVASELQNQTLIISISNSGKRVQQAAGGGVGLDNCRARLTALYGDQAQLSLMSQDDDVVVRVQIPVTERT